MSIRSLIEINHDYEHRVTADDRFMDALMDVMNPIRVQLRRTKGWRMPPNTVKVDRSTRWGNPAVIGEPFEGDVIEDATHAVTTFRDGVAYELEGFPALDAIHRELRGKNLACWCQLPAPGEPDICHAAVLLELANAPEQEG